MASETFYREQIIANCRWYFDQDVQLLSMYNEKGSYWTCFVMPAPSSLKSVARAEGNREILTFSMPQSSRLDTLAGLLKKVEALIQSVYSHGFDYHKFVVNESALPVNLFDSPKSAVEPQHLGDAVPVKAAPQLDRDVIRDEIEHVLAGSMGAMVERLTSSKSKV